MVDIIFAFTVNISLPYNYISILSTPYLWCRHAIMISMFSVVILVIRMQCKLLVLLYCNAVIL